MNIIGSYNLIYNAAIMVEADLGYALCLEKIIPESEDSPLCFKLLDPVLETGVVKKDGNIISIKTLSGKVFRGKMFIDATYEGDLMAAPAISAAGEEIIRARLSGLGYIS